ncbi:MAG: glucose-6-phosphate isomerase, partial [Alphaproteobacteria bacterium]|nr:glucose-6-phosphate isomerase [Alphaproteobacteria bacterium]
MPTPALAAIAALPQADLKSIFKTDPDRLSKLVHQLGPIRFDWSKTHLTDDLVAGFLALADDQGFAQRRDALFAGEAVNNTEGRAAEHPAERGEGHPDSVASAKALHNRMRALIDAIEAGAL